MKLQKLFLTAFGPFTGQTLDFSGPANLHVIYGLNEAGKSSALRAMVDLRYGIPHLSTDNFVHAHPAMRLTAIFQDGAGQVQCLGRVKRRSNALFMADPSTGKPIDKAQVTPEVLLALDGGITREQFVTMHGLDSKRLRQGGEMLIRGEGDPGIALFEASTGATNTRDVLQKLQADAARYFSARGQGTEMALAANQLTESTARYTAALITPEKWDTLNQTHTTAVSQLADCRAQLAQHRRRLAELTELRAVEPLLRDFDRASAQWSQVQHHVALPADAREQRLAALSQQTQAHKALSEANTALRDCQEQAQALQVEPLLLMHAPAIDRLGADVEAVRREAEARLNLSATTQTHAAQLELHAAQMTESVGPVPSLQALVRQLPSAADQIQIDTALTQWQTLTLEQTNLQTQSRHSASQLAVLQRQTQQEPPAALHQALTLALQQAQSLGQVENRLADLASTLGAEQRTLERTLNDMGFSSVAQLTGSRGLALAEIEAFERAQLELDNRLKLNADQTKTIQTDLAVQQRRHAVLAATGEVVSADTLKNARLQRDACWQALRHAYMNAPRDAALVPDPSLPGAFEQSQNHADRQADLLREGAQRAAEVAECQQRISEMTHTLAELQKTRQLDAAESAASQQRWQQTLAGLGLPTGSAARVRAWLGLRQSALEQLERLSASTQAHQLLAQQASHAGAALKSALLALGQPMPAHAERFADWVALGVACDRQMVEQQAAIAQRLKTIASLTQELQEAQDTQTRLSEQLQSCRATLDATCQRLFLPVGAAAEVINARLFELQHWASDYQAHVAQRTQLEQMLARQTSVEQTAQMLGALLQEPAWQHFDAWFDDLSRRLSLSRVAQVQRTALEATQATENQRRQRAQADWDAATARLAALVQQAQVHSAQDLPEAESQSDQRRQVAQQVETLQAQLSRTSAQDVATLRAKLLNLDSIDIDQNKQICSGEIERLEAQERSAISAEQTARLALAAVDTSDAAACARDDMEAAKARWRASVRPWAQLKLAHALLQQALRRHREQAQEPLIKLASTYFKAITGGRFVGVEVDDDGVTPVLKAKPHKGASINMDALSEGSADQLYLALRLAALQVQRQPGRVMPLVLDDVFMTSDNERAKWVFQALEQFAVGGQVLVFTHHQHLVEIAEKTVSASALRVHELPSGYAAQTTQPLDEVTNTTTPNTMR